jgi:hypothetical protein
MARGAAAARVGRLCWAARLASGAARRERAGLREKKKTGCCWAAKSAGLKVKKEKGREGKRFRNFQKRIQTIEFKFEFEFQQPKIMH